MAEVKETVLVEVEISKPEAEKEIDQLTKSLSQLNDENKELLAANKALEQQGQKNSKQHLENSRQIEVNKQKITENTASRKGLIQTIVSEDNSIKSLSVRNRELINQRNQITTTTEQGRQKIAQLNKEIDRNNATIKQNSSALERQKIGIGGYTQAISTLNPALGNMVMMFQNTVRAVGALLATPIGVFLAALAAALAPVVVFLTQTGEGMDIVSRETEGLKSVFRQLKDEVAETGKTMFEWIKGIAAADPRLQALIATYDGLAQAGRDYADTLDEIEEAQRTFNITEKETENEIKRLLLQAKNRTLTEQQRIDLLDLALAKEEELSGTRISQADKALKATINLANAQAGLTQGLKDDKTFAIELMETLKETDEDLAKLLHDAVLKVAEAEGQSIAIQEKAQNQRDALLDKQEEKAQKAHEANLKRSQEELDEFNRRHNEEFFAQEEINEQKAEQEQAYIDRITEMNNVRLERERQQADANRKIQNQVVKDKEKATRDIEMLQHQAIATGMQLFGRNRAAASALTLVDTYLGAQKAFTSLLIEGDPTSYVRATLAAFLSTIQGLARVSAINGIQFARGGILGVKKFFGGGIANNGGVISGPSHADGGVKFSVGGRLGFEAEGGEAIINRKSTAMFRNQLSAINQAGGGVKFATGGVAGSEIRSVARGIERQFTGQDTVFQPVLVLEQFELKQTEVNNLKNQAIVIQ